MSDENEEKQLWEFITREITPIEREAYMPPKSENTDDQPTVTTKKSPQNRIKKAPKSASIQTQVSPALKPPAGQPNGTDHRTSEKLRKGQMPIDAAIDLHGLNIAQAYEAFVNFIISSYASKKRCVLVITGKGAGKNGMRDPLSAGRGVIKQSLPQWITEARIAPYILKTTTAQPKDGGTGATYILLKRHRNHE